MFDEALTNRFVQPVMQTLQSLGDLETALLQAEKMLPTVVVHSLSK